MSASFLREYLDVAAPGGFLPKGREEIGALLECFLLEKAIYELGYEMNNRPELVWLPLRGIVELLDGRAE